MQQFAEYVSLGHPDKIADYISQYLLDRFIEQDPDTRYAVEVQIKDYQVTLGGEVSSRCFMFEDEIAKHVRAAIEEIGYTPDYARRWGCANTINSEMIKVKSYIGQQSPDIAQGLDGWGDQGIFFGYANSNESTHGMPYAHTLAKRLCKMYFESSECGLDVKTQVLADGHDVKKVIVAMPLLEMDAEKITRREQENLSKIFPGAEVIINGTGRYIQHASIADCGTTGRKLAVDFYGGACKIGGGSPWTKDASKADLALNLFAREIARKFAKDYGEVYTSLACCIGRQEVNILVQDAAGAIIAQATQDISPADLRKAYHLDTPIYASMCRWGLFGEYQKDKVWEKY